ncbi:MAG: hypothetical protein ACOZJX_00270 [Pseudomonadota bacterium]
MLIDRELLDGLKQGVLLGAALLVLLLPPTQPWRPAVGPALHSAPAIPPQAAAAPPLARQLQLGGEPASNDVQRVAQWVVGSADNGERPFIIVDKQQAKVFVFEPDGRLKGASPVLLGYAAGDHTVAGIGQRPIEQVRPEERTTPAGRFLGERGLNAMREDVLWVDYDAAVSMHRVRLTNPKERRAERLASATPADNRISYGCINLPPAFFDQVLWPTARQAKPVIYVLPEVKALDEVFPGVSAVADSRAPAAPESAPATSTAPLAGPAAATTRPPA